MEGCLVCGWLGGESQPADEVDVVWGYFGEGFGWCVGFEPEVVDNVENLLGLFGRVVGGLDGGSERPDGALGVGGVEGVYRLVDLGLGECAGCVGAENVGGFGERWGYSGFEVGFVG